MKKGASVAARFSPRARWVVIYAEAPRTATLEKCAGRVRFASLSSPRFRHKQPIKPLSFRFSQTALGDAFLGLDLIGGSFLEAFFQFKFIF